MTIALGKQDEQDEMEAAYQEVMSLPGLSHAEAGPMAQKEYELLAALLGELEGEDWTLPTYCTEWDVRAMVAHLAGAVAGSTTVREFIRQNIFNPYAKDFAEPVDGTNKLQIEERAEMSTAELVAEFREKGQIAVRNRQKLPWLVRNLRAPMGSLGLASIEYLMDTIYVRDQWMHRYDICVATGRPFNGQPAHDRRVTELVLRDIGRKLRRRLGERTIDLRLTGPAGGVYRFGKKERAGSTITIDLFDFNLRASGRITPADALSRAAITGDPSAARWFIDNLEVMY